MDWVISGFRVLIQFQSLVYIVHNWNRWMKLRQEGTQVSVLVKVH